MNEKKTEYLLSQIGEIDDRYLSEALAYRPRIRGGNWLKVLAASVAVFFAVAVIFPTLLRMEIFDQKSENQASGDQGNAERYDSLDLLLADVKDAGHQKLASFESLSYTEGSASLVWQYGDGEIYTAPLTRQELIELKAAVGKGRDVGAQAPRFECKVWILDGQGNVATPYLKASEGNLGRAVFDYEAEIYPSDRVISCMMRILNRNAN